MKANLKGLDFQKLLIAHGEKIGLGVIVLFSLFAVGGMTRWATYSEKSPEEIIQQVAAEKDNLERSQWPETEQQQYAPRHDISQSAQMMMAEVDVSDFVYPPGQKLIQSLYKYQDPIRESPMLPVQDLLATDVRIPIQVIPTSTETEEDKDTDDKSTKPEDKPASDDPRLQRRDIARGGGAGGGASGYGAGSPGGYGVGGPGGGAGASAYGGGPGNGYSAGPPLGGGGTGYQPPAVAEGASGVESQYGSESAYGGGYGGYGGAGSAARNIEVEGVRFVAVRGWYPLREQIEKFLDALGDPDRVKGEPSQLVEVLDFELERQAAQPGADPWSGDWERMTVEKAKDVLSRAELDQEVVNVSITDPVITCPLPFRVMGDWDIEASHPQVKDFHLTPQGRELQGLIQEKLAEWEDEQKQAQQMQGPQKGGFSDIIRNSGRAAMQFSQSAGQGGQGQYQQQFSQLFGNTPGGRQPADQQKQQADLQDQLKQMVTAAAGGRVLLFRFFDYTIAPGNAYRYRVRLVLKNPFYGSSPEDAVDPSVVQGETRKTDWSQPTAPVYVEEDAEYFLRLAESSDRALQPDKAFLDIYQWLPTVGTKTKGLVEVALGQLIGGKVKTKVVVPEKEVTVKEVEFNTSTALVDISDGNRKLDPSEHAALGLKSGQLELLDQAIVVNESGELVALNPFKDAAERQENESWVQQVQELYKDLEKEKVPAAGGEENPYGGGYGGGYSGGGAAQYGGGYSGGGAAQYGGGGYGGGYGASAGQRRSQRAGRGSAVRKTGGSGGRGRPGGY